MVTARTPRHLWKDETFRTWVPGPLSPDSPVFPPPPEGRTYVEWYGGHRGPAGHGTPQPSKFEIPCPWAAACGPLCGAEARCVLARGQGAAAGETVPVVDLDAYLERFLKRHLKGIGDPAQREQERARFYGPDLSLLRVEEMADQDLARIMSKLTWGMLRKAYLDQLGPRNLLQTHLVRFHSGRLPPQLAELEPLGMTTARPWQPPGALEIKGGVAKKLRRPSKEDADGGSSEEEDEEDEDEGSHGDEESSDEEDEEEEGSQFDQEHGKTGPYGRAARALPVAAPPSGRRQGPLVRPASAMTAPAAAAAKANGGGEPRPLKRQRNTGPGPAPAVAPPPAPAARQPGARGEQGRGPEPGGQAAADAERKRRKAAEAALAATQRRAAALEQELAAAVNEAAAERRQRRKAAAEAEQSARDLAEQLAAAEAAADEAQAQAAEEAEARDAAEERLAAAQAEVEAERGLRRVVEAQLGQERARVRMLTQAARQGGQGGAGAE